MYFVKNYEQYWKSSLIRMAIGFFFSKILFYSFTRYTRLLFFIFSKHVDNQLVSLYTADALIIIIISTERRPLLDMASHKAPQNDMVLCYLQARNGTSSNNFELKNSSIWNAKVTKYLIDPLVFCEKFAIRNGT